MTAAVSTDNLNERMSMARSPVRRTGRRAIANYGASRVGQRGLRRTIGATMNPQAVKMGMLVDVEANPEATTHATGEAS